MALATQSGFILVTLISYGILFTELKKVLPKTGWEVGRQKKIFNLTLFVIVAWTALISALSLSGFIQDFSAFPPRIMIVLVIPLITIIRVTFSKTLKEILIHIPNQNIIRLQTFRVFVEILLWMLLLQNLAPIQMSFEGRNFDVITGLSAPIIAYFFSNNKLMMRLWNLAGLGLLLNILTIAVLSMPTPLRVFMNEPSNTIVTAFPYVLLPGLLVPLAYGLHFFSLRKPG